MNNTQITIYILGFIETWIMCKLFRGKREEYNTWTDVLVTFLLSFFSWVSVIFIALVWTIMKMKNTRPPKWL